jgi:hypothetical protein
MKSFVSFLLLIIVFSCVMGGTVYAAPPDENSSGTVILSSKDDPYYLLAEEMSEAESIPIYQTFEEAAEVRPVFLLWVVAPENLSESVLIDFSSKLNELDTSVSIGIISGKTIKDACGLWKGSSQITVSDYAIINGTKKNKIEPEIIYGEEAAGRTELTMQNIRAALQSADAIQVSLEGAVDLWFDKSLGITIESEDIPELDSCIIQHYGCTTFRPWEENSIALECISKGAAAYCGFVYPSIAGTRFGDYSDISMIYTWEEFPLGHLVQLQNHAAMQSYANAPHYFMLGDPRIYCRSNVPYDIASDDTSEDARTIRLTNVESGLIPIYIEDGAGYEFISIQGLASSAMDSSYFNSRLQMIDVGGDKYIIIDNDSDTVTIELSKDAPFLSTLSSNVLDFLDSVFLQNQGSSQPMLIALPLLVLLAIGMLRKRYTGRQLAAALIFGVATAILSWFYILARSGNIVATNIPVKVNWYHIVGIFIFAGYGELLYAKAKKPRDKFIAVLVANLNIFVTFIIFAVCLLVMRLMAGEAYGINKPGYPLLFSFKELVTGNVVFFALYHFYNIIPAFRRKAKPVSEEGII